MRNKYLINIFRLGFLFVLAWEILRWKVFKGSVTFTWQGLLLTIFGVIFILEGTFYLLHKKNIEMHWPSYAGALLSLSLDAFGDMFGWYDRFSPWFDKSLHFIGGGVVALILYDVLSQIREKNPNSLSKSWIFVLMILGALFFGFAYEWLEYAEDVFYWGHQVRLGDAYDTIDDIDMDLLGGIAVTILAITRSRRMRHQHPEHFIEN